MDPAALLNFEGSAADMAEFLKKSGAVTGDSEANAKRVAAAPASAPAASCGDPDCTHDHSHDDHGHDHSHSHSSGHGHAEHGHGKGGEHGKEHGHGHHEHGKEHGDGHGHGHHEHAKDKGGHHDSGGHGGHGHTHEHLDHPGEYSKRDTAQVTRKDFDERAFTVGIGGPVGTGKTALLLALCRAMGKTHNMAAITNDIFTREDGEFLTRHNALPHDRIRAVETGGCPHAAIREDISANLLAAEELTAQHKLELLFVESGGDNLAANFSKELADFTIYVIDVAGGDKVPRKGGPGITQSDLLIINKTDLAELIGADLGVMDRDAKKMRGNGPTVFAQVKNGVEVETIMHHISTALKDSQGGTKKKAKHHK
mmetsp:Transcript_85202/g.241433  ORF Transcript_85202/g.241433 Transcript_85202/m.241433 type:complete len:369 (+) Transcript_85202:132-1238(+)